MSAPQLDVVAIGNAIVDILAPVDEALIVELGLVKGGMQLVDAQGADALYKRMGQAVESSGGSAGNTIAGLASLGRNCGFIGQVADDQFGKVFSHDIRALGVTFETPVAADGPPTAQCLIFVTPDGQRTMNTYLGASQNLGVAALDVPMIERSDILYLEGYLWNADASRDAMIEAVRIAKAQGRKVAFSLSDNFVIFGHRESIMAMIESDEIDILFANDTEICTLSGEDDFDAAVKWAAARVPTLVATRGADGAVAVKTGEYCAIPSEPVEKVVDTTGAGDLFAAGFLAGQAEGRSLEQSLIMGAVCAAEVISHFGPRPEANLRKLVDARLG